MPTKKQVAPEVSIEQVVAHVGLYPIEAYEMIQQGLSFTVQRLHGEQKRTRSKSRHVNGQQLCQGIRDYAMAQWGFLARTVLSRWNITATLDFGRIVFALIEAGLMSKTDDDTLEDFKHVFDFKNDFETAYRIEVPVAGK